MIDTTDTYFPPVRTISGVFIGAVPRPVDHIERGALVRTVPGLGVRVRVPLRQAAHIGGIEISGEADRVLRALENPTIGAVAIDGVEIAGLLSKVKKGVKKAVKATVKVAKKVAKNKVTKALYNTVKAAAPPPINTAIAATEAGVKLGKALAKGNKKAKKAEPVAKKLAAGKITPAQADREARKIGVKPESIKGAAVVMKLQSSNSPEAAKILKTAQAIEKASEQEGEEPPTKSMDGPGKQYTIPIRGQRFRVRVEKVA